ncbi:MAG: glycosyltransferase [Phycisphaeraceae bacterium]|nr:glycosyltransferase [Phycisphaeraceae bacterium]
MDQARTTSQPPLLSIVTPVRNQAQFLPRCLASVRDQPHGIAEHIVLDGASHDGCAEILHRAPGLSHRRSEPDRGQSHAINKGFALAQGRFGAWLNADDWYLPGALREVAAFFLENPETDMLVCRARFVAQDGRIVHEPIPPERIDEPALLSLRSAWFAGHSIAQPEVFFRLELYREVGGLDEDNHHSMDHHLWLKLVERGARVRQIRTLVACQGVHPGQKTADRLAATRSIIKGSRAWLDRRAQHWPLQAPHVRTEIEALERKLELATRYTESIDRAFAREGLGPVPSAPLAPPPRTTPPGWLEALQTAWNARTHPSLTTLLVSPETHSSEADQIISKFGGIRIAPDTLLNAPTPANVSHLILHRALGDHPRAESLLRTACAALRPGGLLIVSAEVSPSEPHDLYLKRLRTRAANKVTQPDDFIIGPRADATLRPLLESSPNPLIAHPWPRGLDLDSMLSRVDDKITPLTDTHFGGYNQLPLAPFPVVPKLGPKSASGSFHDCWRTISLMINR